MNFENSVTYDLMQLAIGYRTYLQKAMNEIGLHSGQVFILIRLWKTDGLSQIDLVNNLKIASPTINKMVKSLMKGGFVECRKCGIDGRMTRVYLTEKGRQSESLTAVQWSKLDARLYSNLTETEKLVLSQLFIKLKENLKKDISALSDALKISDK